MLFDRCEQDTHRDTNTFLKTQTQASATPPQTQVSKPHIILYLNQASVPAQYFCLHRTVQFFIFVALGQLTNQRDSNCYLPHIEEESSRHNDRHSEHLIVRHAEAYFTTR